MDLKDIEEIINLVGNSKLTEFELESRDCSVKMKKESSAKDDISNKKSEIPEDKEKETKGSERNIQRKLSSRERKNDNELYFVKSPMAGTFYALASSEKKPFVYVGSKIKKGDVLCIIEAAKLMNEIKSEVDGEIAEVFIKNGDTVEFGEQLFSVKILNEKQQ